MAILSYAAAVKSRSPTEAVVLKDHEPEVVKFESHEIPSSDKKKYFGALKKTASQQKIPIAILGNKKLSYVKEHGFDEIQIRVSEAVNSTFTEERLSKALKGNGPLLVAGADLSFFDKDGDVTVSRLAAIKAVCNYNVISYAKHNVTGKWTFQARVHTDTEVVDLTTPYIPFYLAFRESSHIVDAYLRQAAQNSPYLPHVIMTDGNGLIHEMFAGLACHVGVKLGVPTVGVAKSRSGNKKIDPMSIDKALARLRQPNRRFGDIEPVKSRRGRKLGYILKTGKKPLYVSPGHLVTPEDAVRIATLTIAPKDKDPSPGPLKYADEYSRVVVSCLSEELMKQERRTGEKPMAKKINRDRNKEGKEKTRPLKKRMAPNQQQGDQHKRQDMDMPAPKRQPGEENVVRSSKQKRQDKKMPNSKSMLVQKPNLR